MQPYDADGPWRFCDWAKANKAESDWRLVRRLRTKPVQELSTCTEAVIEKASRNLLALLQQEHILRAFQPERFVCTDEKGFSERGGAIVKGVIARHHARRAVASQTLTSCL